MHNNSIVGNIKLANLIIGISLWFVALFASCSKDSRDFSRNPDLIHINKQIKNIEKNSDQNSRDSLHRYLGAIKSDSLRLDLSFDISNNYLQNGDSLEFRYWNNFTNSLSKKINNIDKIAESKWDLANFFYRNNVPDSAYFYYAKAQQFYMDSGNDFYASRMLLNMAVVQENFKDFSGSETTTFEALRTFENLDKSFQRYISYSNLGVIYNGLEDPQNSIKFHNKALSMAGEMNDSILIAKTLNNIGAMYSDRKEYEVAGTYFEKALKVDSLLHKDPSLFATLTDNHAFTRFKIEPENPKILEDYESALAIRQKIDKSSGIIMSWIHLGEWYLNAVDTALANEYFIKAEKLAKNTNDYDYLLESLSFLDKANPQKKMYLRNYLKLNDSLVEEERKTRNKFTRIRYETDSYIAKTKILTEQRLYLLIFILLGLVSSVMAYYYFSQRSRNRVLMIKQEQQKSNEKIYDLLLTQHTQMEVGKEKERQRIAGELHDGVLGRLFGTRMSLGFLDNIDQEGLGPYLTELQNIEKEIREISHDLMSKKESMVGRFIPIIKDLIEDKKRTIGLQIELIIEDNLNLENLSPNVQVNLYRILQESIQNVIKHAGTKRIDVTFRSFEGMIEMTVKDYGMGMDVHITTEGIGIKSMRNRIALLNGEMKISSNSNGTEIRYNLPINA